MADFPHQLMEHFAQEVRNLPTELLEVCQDLDDDMTQYCAQRAIQAAMAPVIWGKTIGDRFSTSEVVKALCISRQALGKKVAAKALLGLPGRNTTYYPKWQFKFDGDSIEIRPIVREIIAAFAPGANCDSYSIAAWATTPQRRDLDGMTPAEWIAKDLDGEAVLVAARHDCIS